MSTHEHKKHAPQSVCLAIVSVSSTRRLAEDQSGHWMADQARDRGHTVKFHQVIDDDSDLICRTVEELVADEDIQSVILTGGTGVGSRDVTIEAVKPMLSKELVAFAPLFAHLSYDQVDSAAIMSRATAGVVGRTVVFCLPGSLKACQLACEKLIFPEIGHLAHHIQKG
jgi:molybdenum cofactor biosynthesis protein B